VNPRRAITIVAGNTNGNTKTTTENWVNPVLLLWTKSPPKTPTNSTASHMGAQGESEETLMARKPSGAVVEHTGKDGRTYRSLRFTAYGTRRYVSLGAVTAQDAATALRYALADVERGIWQPPERVQAPAQPAQTETFHQLAERWWLMNETDLRPRTQVDYRWRLEKHLLPFFRAMPIDTITYDTVKQYIARKQRDAAKIRSMPPEQRRLVETVDTRGRVRRQRERPLGARDQHDGGPGRGDHGGRRR
jgi:Phage integrase, N-terminal SAM-like domain